MDFPTKPSLPPADEIRHLAQDIVHRSVYDLGPTGLGEPWQVQVLHYLRSVLGPLSDWFESFYHHSPMLGTLLIVSLFAISIALIAHIVYSFRTAFRKPNDYIFGNSSVAIDLTPEDFEQRARAAAKKGEFIEAVRLLFMASLMTLETAQKRVVRRGTTNREYLKRFKNTPAFDPLFFLVEIVDRKWYAGVPCTEQDFQESLRAYAAIQQAARANAKSLAELSREAPTRVKLP